MYIGYQLCVSSRPRHTCMWLPKSTYFFTSNKKCCCAATASSAFLHASSSHRIASKHRIASHMLLAAVPSAICSNTNTQHSRVGQGRAKSHSWTPQSSVNTYTQRERQESQLTLTCPFVYSCRCDAKATANATYAQAGWPQGARRGQSEMDCTKRTGIYTPSFLHLPSSHFSFVLAHLLIHTLDDVQKSGGDMEMQEGSKSLTATSNIADANALDTRRNRIGVGKWYATIFILMMKYFLFHFTLFWIGLSNSR